MPMFFQDPDGSVQVLGLVGDSAEESEAAAASAAAYNDSLNIRLRNDGLAPEIGRHYLLVVLNNGSERYEVGRCGDDVCRLLYSRRGGDVILRWALLPRVS